MHLARHTGLGLATVVFASFALHALLLALTPPAVTAHLAVPLHVELEFEIGPAPNPGPPAPAPSQLPSAAVSVVAPARSARARAVNAASSAPQSAAREVPAVTAAVVSAPSPSPPPSAATPLADGPAWPHHVDLSAHAAAFSLIANEPRPAAAPSREAQLSAALNAQLMAATRPSAAARKLDLQRDPDGTCHYAGRNIDATILPDGGVRFVDKPGELDPRYGVAEPTARPTSLEDLEAPKRFQIGVKYVARASAAERDWFMRESEVVRRELADAARDHEAKGDALGLRKQLERIWCDETRSLALRKRAIFELWNETSADAVGERGRNIVLDFVRSNAPQHSAVAFTAEELATYNARREPSARFEPYAPL